MKTPPARQIAPWSPTKGEGPHVRMCPDCEMLFNSPFAPPTPRTMRPYPPDPKCPGCLHKHEAGTRYSYQQKGKLLFRTPADREAAPLPPDVEPKSYPAILVFYEVDPDPLPPYLVTWWVYPEDFER